MFQWKATEVSFFPFYTEKSTVFFKKKLEEILDDFVEREEATVMLFRAAEHDAQSRVQRGER